MASEREVEAAADAIVIIRTRRAPYSAMGVARAALEAAERVRADGATFKNPPVYGPIGVESAKELARAEELYKANVRRYGGDGPHDSCPTCGQAVNPNAVVPGDALIRPDHPSFD
jgi:hypothetical protein